MMGLWCCIRDGTHADTDPGHGSHGWYTGSKNCAIRVGVRAKNSVIVSILVNERPHPASAVPNKEEQCHPRRSWLNRNSCFRVLSVVDVVTAAGLWDHDGDRTDAGSGH